MDQVEQAKVETINDGIAILRKDNRKLHNTQFRMDEILKYGVAIVISVFLTALILTFCLPEGVKVVTTMVCGLAILGLLLVFFVLLLDCY